MAVEYDLTAIYDKLKSLPSKEAQLAYLNDYLFGLRKKVAEFSGFDQGELDRLKKKTDEDYDRYKSAFDAGDLIYWSDSLHDEVIADGLKIKNLPLLKRRLSLEAEINDLNVRRQIFEALISKLNNDHSVEWLLEQKEHPKPSESKPTGLPVFVETNVEEVCQILGAFFPKPDQVPLEQLLTKGIRPKSKLLFQGSANQLADTFKRLINKSLITGCTKGQLETWVLENFEYVHNGKEGKPLNKKYLHNYISAVDQVCKNPIIEIIDGQDGRTIVKRV